MKRVNTYTLLGLAAPVLADSVTCGVSHGYDRGTNAYFYSGDGSLSNFDACSNECLSSAQCESFAFGDSQCLLYTTPLDTNFREQDNSPFLFYDRDCKQVQSTSSFATVLPSTTSEAAAATTALTTPSTPEETTPAGETTAATTTTPPGAAAAAGGGGTTPTTSPTASTGQKQTTSGFSTVTQSSAGAGSSGTDSSSSPSATSGASSGEDQDSSPDSSSSSGTGTASASASLQTGGSSSGANSMGVKVSGWWVVGALVLLL